MTQFSFSKVLEWLRAERREYQTNKFDYEKEAKRIDDFGYWDQQFSSYIQRLGVFPKDSQQFAQAALKLAATAVALCEHIAAEYPLPKPGVSSGTIEEWHLNFDKVVKECTECGRDLHGYVGPLCRYCDPNASCE
jgi:hypothetical protein